jgi:integrase
MARIYKRGKVWWAAWWDGAAREHRRESLRTQDREVARAALRQLEMGAYRAPDPEPYNLMQALDYLVDVAAAGNAPDTREMYMQKGRHLLRLIGPRDLTEIRLETTETYIAMRLNEGAHRHGVAKELVTLRRALKAARKRGLWAGEPSDVIPPYRAGYTPRDRYLSREEFDVLIRQVRPRRRLWLMVAVYAGPCLRELEALRWELHVDFGSGMLRLPGTKRESRWRLVPIADALREWLELHALDLGPVVERWGNYRRDLAEACERAGIAPVTANDLRRTFASWLLQSGASNRMVADLLGHTSTRMVDLVYGKLSAKVLSDAVARLPCPSGVRQAMTEVAVDGTRGNRRIAASAEVAVPRVGIEPTTRGFSGPTSSDPNRWKFKLYRGGKP